MSPERDDEPTPDDERPEVFDAGEQPTAGEVPDERTGPEVWIQRGKVDPGKARRAPRPDAE